MFSLGFTTWKITTIQSPILKALYPSNSDTQSPHHPSDSSLRLVLKSNASSEVWSLWNIISSRLTIVSLPFYFLSLFCQSPPNGRFIFPQTAYDASLLKTFSFSNIKPKSIVWAFKAFHYLLTYITTFYFHQVYLTEPFVVVTDFKKPVLRL